MWLDCMNIPFLLETDKYSFMSAFQHIAQLIFFLLFYWKLSCQYLVISLITLQQYLTFGNNALFSRDIPYILAVQLDWLANH